MSVVAARAEGTATRGPCAGRPINPDLLRLLEPLFWPKVSGRDTDGCWSWSSGHLRTGYAQITLNHKAKKHAFMAHRVAYELLVGPIPTGITLDHLCRNRGCINPEHLEPVTHAENCRRGRQARAA